MKIYHISQIEKLYHSSLESDLTSFLAYSHFGNLDQAEGKAGILLSESRMIDAETIPTIYIVMVTTNNSKRVKDVGDNAWGLEIRKAEREGFDSIIYENEYEGEGMSYIIFDSSDVTIIDKFFYSGEGWRY